MTGTILTRQEGRVRVVSLNRPQQLNAWNDDLFNDFRVALEEAEAHDGTAVVVVTGEGRAFSAGADMGVLDAGPPGAEKPKPVPPAETAFGRALFRTTSFPKPLICAINGVAIGWGVTMLGHCDFVFMAKDARLRTPFTQLGLTAEGGSTVTFAAKMGWANAAHMLMTSRFFSAEEAKNLGMVYKVCEKDKLMAETMEYATELAAQPIASLIATKRLMLGAGRPEQVMQAHDREMRAFASGLTGGPANREAIAAFREKRTPDFSKL